MSNTRTLDLGCGPNPKNPFNAGEVYGIDVRNLGPNIVAADLVIEPIPFESAMFDFVTAFDFLEHVPRLLYAPQRRNCFVELMNEIWRVLKPGGQFFSMTPVYPHPWAFRDPTHVNFITEETFPLYFDDTHRWAQMYGFTGAFEIMEQQSNGPHLLSLLRKVEAPEPAV